MRFRRRIHIHDDREPISRFEQWYHSNRSRDADPRLGYEARVDGKEARKANRPKASNPHPQGTVEYWSWNYGWDLEDRGSKSADTDDGPFLKWLGEHGFTFASPDHAVRDQKCVQATYDMHLVLTRSPAAARARTMKDHRLAGLTVDRFGRVHI